MASMSQLVEDVFTCSLCLEKVREPRTLPCLHTFCRYCLSAYVRQKVKDWVFPCPLCGQDTRPNTKGLSVDQWLDTFPASNFLTQLMRVLEARQAEHACDICRQEQVLVEAIVWCRTCMEALCSDCQRVHKRSRASRDHALFSMDSLVHDPLEKLVGSAAREGAAWCQEHQGKTATLVCVTCKKLVCETCISLSHATCRRIEQAEKAIPSFRKDVAGAMQHLMTHVQATHSEVKWVEDQLDKLTHSREFAMAAVEDLKQRLLQAVENRSSKLLAELETVYRKQRQDFVARGEKSRELGRILGKTVNFLEHLLAYGLEYDMLNNFDNVIQQTRIVDTQIAAFKHGNDDMVMKFTPDKKATETLLSLTSLGDIKVVKNSGRGPKEQPKEENTKKASRGDMSERAAAVVSTARFSPRRLSSLQGSSPRTSFSTTPKTKLVATFSGRTNTDTMRTDLRGIVSLRSGDIIVMDLHFRNRRLKKFSPRGKLISVVDTGECPYGMALIPDMDLVVTHPRSREFVFVAAGGTLHVSGRIKTHKSYYSLASSATSGVLAAVAANPPEPTSIDMISFEGEVLKTISLDRVRFPLQPKDIFLPPSGDILLLFGAKEALVCLTDDGSVRYSFQCTQQQDIKRPVSLDGDVSGNAYIADMEASKIHAVTADGKYRGELLSRKDGVREPLAIGVNDQGQILVTQANGDVKVYNV